MLDVDRSPEVIDYLPTAERARRGLAMLAMLYALAAGFTLAVFPQSKPWRFIPDWIAAPAQCMAIASASMAFWGRLQTRERSTAMWGLVLGFCIMNLIASYVWNVWRPLGTVPALSIADFFYFVDYGLLTAAYGIAFARLGGSFRDPRQWLDAATIMVALLGTFWATLLGTFWPRVHSPTVDTSYAVLYAMSLAAWMAMATLMFLRLSSLRPIPMLLIGAGLVDAVWEVGWLATWLTDHNYVGYFYNYGDVLCLTLITCAAAITPRGPDLELGPESEQRSAYEFVPMLAALLATALVGACLASTRAPDAWLLVGLIILTTLLLVTRQGTARRQLAELNRLFAVRVADARLTELARQSADAFMVIDHLGRVTYASPATATTLGISPSFAIGAQASALLGRDDRATFDRFIKNLIHDPRPPPPLELQIDVPAGEPRIIKVCGVNSLKNSLIEGLTLTISDISEQRALERGVLTAATHERLELAGDIHDGLGQELAGISLLLQSLTKSPRLDLKNLREDLQKIVGYVGDAIQGTRDLALGLSPIYVVRGSLRDALRRLQKEGSNEPDVRVDIDPVLEAVMFDELPADHLFRIAREAVRNAVRHASCSQVSVRLEKSDDMLILEISDDGVGYGTTHINDTGFGLRLMEYRARVIGAAFDIKRRSEGGTVVRVSVRLSKVVTGRTVAPAEVAK